MKCSMCKYLSSSFSFFTIKFYSCGSLLHLAWSPRNQLHESAHCVPDTDSICDSMCVCLYIVCQLVVVGVISQTLVSQHRVANDCVTFVCWAITARSPSLLTYLYFYINKTFRCICVYLVRQIMYMICKVLVLAMCNCTWEQAADFIAKL